MKEELLMEFGTAFAADTTYLKRPDFFLNFCRMRKWISCLWTLQLVG